jgi:hypothetical protein
VEAILERVHHQAEDALSATHHHEDDSLGVTSIPEASGLLLRESAVAFSECELEADRLKVQ